MENPFEYSNVVLDQSFCNRVDEQETLLEFIQNSQNVLLYSHRRTGKSSLVKQVLKNIKDRGLNIGGVYVDLYGSTSETDFVSWTFKRIGSLKSSIEKLMDFLKDNFRQLPFKVGVDPVTFTPVLTSNFKDQDKELPLKSLMDLLEKFSRERKLVVVFDEFQEITKYEGAEAFEKRLRSFTQQQQNISFIFSGSQTHLLTAMFQNQTRAFYQQAASFPLKEIPAKAYLSWLEALFSKGGYQVPRQALEKIIARLDNHPMYIQLFCYHLWGELKNQAWDDSMPDRIESAMIGNKQAEFQMLWDSLTLNQRKTLKLVLLQNGRHLFTTKAMTTMDIKTASVVSRCVKTLCEKEILVKHGNAYRVQDLFLGKWVGQKV